MPLGQQRIMNNGHLVLEILRHFAPRLLELVKKMDKNFHASTGLRLLHEVFPYLNAGENDPLARPGEMRKKTMLNRIVL